MTKDLKRKGKHKGLSVEVPRGAQAELLLEGGGVGGPPEAGRRGDRRDREGQGGPPLDAACSKIENMFLHL